MYVEILSLRDFMHILESPFAPVVMLLFGEVNLWVMVFVFLFDWLSRTGV